MKADTHNSEIINNLIEGINTEEQKRIEKLMELESKFYLAFVGQDEINIDPIFKLFAQSAARIAAKICLEEIKKGG